VVEVESQSGTIELRVPAEHVAEFDLITIGGTITNTGEVQPRPRAAGTGLELRFATGGSGGQVSQPAASRAAYCWNPSDQLPGLIADP